MQLVKITARNFLSYRELNFDNPAPVNIFIGQNSVGKSNLMELFRTLARLSKGEVPFNSLIFDQKDEIAKITLELSCSEQERKMIINQLFAKNANGVTPDNVMNTNFLRIIGYELDFGGKGIENQKLYTTDGSGGIMTLVKYDSRENTKVEMENLEEVCKNLRGINDLTENPLPTMSSGGGRPSTILNYGGYSIQIQLAKLIQEFLSNIKSYTPMRNASNTLPAGEDYILDEGGTNVVRVLHTIQSKNPRKYVSMMDDIAKIFPFLKQILSPLTGSNVTITAEENNLENPIGIDFLSAGIKQAMILVTGILAAKDGSIIFIEEPESHLHAAAQRALFDLIKRQSKTKQFFITTHSPIFTGYGTYIKTFLVRKVAGASEITLIKEPEHLRIIKHELGHKNTDLFGYNSIVFIEGDTEELALPILAEALGYDFVDHGIRLINVKGSGKLKKIEEYLLFLKDSDIRVYLIADGDKEVIRKVNDWKTSQLLKDDCITIWDKEFEDCFGSEVILEAMCELAGEEGFKFIVSNDQLNNKRGENKFVAKLLQEHLFENNQKSLDKPALGEKIATILANEIKGGNIHRLPTEVKNAIENIFRSSP